MTQRLGKAALGWSSTGDTMTERLHLLATPLRNTVPAHSRSVYTAESLDRSVRETLVVGDGMHELIGDAVFDDNPQSLLDVVKAGAEGQTLDYYPDLRDPGVKIPCALIEPSLGELELALDAKRGTFGNATVRLRLRPTSGDPVGTLYQASNILFNYRAGDSIEAATFSRASVGAYIDKGYGTLKSAASGKARLTYIDLDSDGIREFPALLQEMSRTNLITLSEDLNSWTDGGTPVITTGQADPLGGTAATLIEDNSAAAEEYKARSLTFTGDAVKGVSVWAKAHATNNPAGGGQVQIRDTTAGAYRLQAVITFTLGVPSVAMTVGTHLFTERYVDGWYRFQFACSSVTAANTHQMRLSPAGTTVSAVGSMYFFGAQAEDATFPSSYIPTTGSTAARAVDSLTFPFLGRPQAMTIYLRFREMHTGTSSDLVFLALTNMATGARIYLGINSGSGGQYKFIYTDGTTVITAPVTANAVIGDIVELRATLTGAGVAQLHRTRNSGTESSGTAQSALVLPQAWASSHLMLNSAGSAAPNIAQYLNATVVRGVHDLDAMRRVARI
jgi:hypothetical protein